MGTAELFEESAFVLMWKYKHIYDVSYVVCVLSLFKSDSYILRALPLHFTTRFCSTFHQNPAPSLKYLLLICGVWTYKWPINIGTYMYQKYPQGGSEDCIVQRHTWYSVHKGIFKGKFTKIQEHKMKSEFNEHREAAWARGEGLKLKHRTFVQTKISEWRQSVQSSSKSNLHTSRGYWSKIAGFWEKALQSLNVKQRNHFFKMKVAAA